MRHTSRQIRQRIVLWAGFMLCGFFLSAQPYVVKGRVVDATTLKSLAFVNILFNGNNSVGVSDPDGRFMVRFSGPVTKLIFSCPGYQVAEVFPDTSGREITVNMKKLESAPSRAPITPDLKAAQRIIDSIAIAEYLNKSDKRNEAIIKGHPSLGIFDLDMNRFFHYNRYQGLYLGLGLHTNDRLSTLFSLGGYWGYGFGSQSAAYGVDGILVIERLSETTLKLELSHDVSESGGLPGFGESKRLIDPSGFYQWLVRRMDLTDLRQVTLSTGLLKYLRAGISFFQSVKTPTYNYAYVISQGSGIAVLGNQFHFSGLSLNLRYAYGDKRIQNSSAGISPATTFPVLWMQFTRGIEGWFGSEYSSARFDLKVEKSFYSSTIGRTSFCLQAGAASGDLPYCNLFTGRGSYGKFTIFAPQSFATMRQNEFVSDRYASLYFMQDFGKLIYQSKYLHPELAWCVSAGVGDLSHPEKHRDIDIRTLSKGYFESGILINNLLNLRVYNIGLGAFYRLGYYAFPAFGDNIAFKFSVNFPLKPQ